MSYGGAPPNFWVSNVFVSSYNKATKRDTPPLMAEQKLAQWMTVFQIVKERNHMSYEELATSIAWAFMTNPLKLKNVDEYGVLDVRTYNFIAGEYTDWLASHSFKYPNSGLKGGHYLNAAIKEITRHLEHKKAKSKRTKNAVARAKRFSEFDFGKPSPKLD